WGESDSGGTWGQMLKRTGYDGILVSGASDAPVYLWVTSEQVEIRPAQHLWGVDTYDVDPLLKAETTSRAVILAIGPAGERLAHLAAIMNDGHDGRAAGRAGLGAVMGSKRLKAIVVFGTLPMPIAHPDALLQAVKQTAPVINERTRSRRDFGTAGGVLPAAAIGDAPIRNWTLGTWDRFEKISGQRMAKTILKGKYFCAACTIGCGREVEVTSGPYAPVKGAGPEYETLVSLGSMCLVDDLEAIALANESCNRYGLDTISTGGAIAFALEAFERGLLTIADTGGLVLTWGNPRVMLTLVRQIGLREGIGKLLGEGVREAARQIGRGAEEFALHVRGLELAQHDPRSMNSLAVAYATYPRGTCHRGCSHYLERHGVADIGYEKGLPRQDPAGKGRMVAKIQDYAGLFNSLKVCQFIMAGTLGQDLVRYLNLTTGWDVTLEELLTIGERASNLKRMYNVRLGQSRREDVLPRRILEEPLAAGGAGNYLPPLEAMLEEYYATRGWDANGIPTPETLRRLGLVWTITDLPPPSSPSPIKGEGSGG
ncbi:MAG TPA: aldehyde ferredoxin oxidoreductase family protein, partial [Candidatus Methylomirabilis sp.]|nr:aldehyde ferredoxin oxidoreductase family protein [Candidatus Methylomirabilis sp.]